MRTLGLVVWKVCHRDGTSTHYGHEGTARAYSRGDPVERIELDDPPEELTVVPKVRQIEPFNIGACRIAYVDGDRMITIEPCDLYSHSAADLGRWLLRATGVSP